MNAGCSLAYAGDVQLFIQLHQLLQVNESVLSSLLVPVEENLRSLWELACKSRVSSLVVQECSQTSFANEFLTSKNSLNFFIVHIDFAFGFLPSALRAGLKLKRFPSLHSCSENRSKPVSQVLPATGSRSLSNRLLRLPSSRPDSGCESSILATALNTVELTWSVSDDE